MTALEYARHCWTLIQRLQLEHREDELVMMMRLLAQSGDGLDAIPATEDEVRAALTGAPRTLQDAAFHWGEAQQSYALDDLWFRLGQMEAALILDQKDYTSIGISEADIAALIARLRSKP